MTQALSCPGRLHGPSNLSQIIWYLGPRHLILITCLAVIQHTPESGHLQKLDLSNPEAALSHFIQPGQSVAELDESHE